MKILLAVITCHEFRERADAQRRTWCSLVLGADVRFFLGQGGFKERDDEIVLDVPDDYLSLPYKCQAAFRWALDHGYDYVLKLDDDVYVQPDRLLRSDFQYDYVGTVSPNKDCKVPYASGFAYWLSRPAIKILLESEIADWAEDQWTGKSLSAAGICLHEDSRYVLIHALNLQNLPLTGTEGPREGNDIIAAAELNPVMMQEIHRTATAQREEVDDAYRAMP